MNAPLSNLRADIEMMRAHIELLTEPVRTTHPDLRFEIAWSDDTGQVSQAQTFPLNEIEDAVKFAAKKNVAPTNLYIGAILKRADTPRDGRTKASHSALATALAVDIDENARECAAKLCARVKPGALVLTGKTPKPRMQAWLRVEPTDDLPTFDALTKRAVAFCGGDKKATGLNRVMRLAGSMSYPPPHKQARGYIVEQTKASFLQAASYVLDELLAKFPVASNNKSTLAAGIDDGLGVNTVVAMPPPSVETMRAMLQHLAARNYFEHRSGVDKDDDDRIITVGWLETGMALKAAYGDKDGSDLWAITHIDERAHNDAPEQWKSFADEAQPGHVTIGTIIKAAKDAGLASSPPPPISAGSCKAATTASGFVSFGLFTMDANDGLTKMVRAGKGINATIDAVWISAPFEVLGACRDPHGRAWGKQVRFRDDDKRVHMRHVSDAALQGEPGALCAALAEEGLKINRSKQQDLAEYLSRVRVNERVTVVTRTGWHRIGERLVFVLPAETIPANISETVALDQTAIGPYEARSSLEDWKQGVGRLTAGHSLPMFMVSAALAGPLAHLVGAEGGGVHVFGNSSIGKSAMLAAAASVWGRGSTPGFVRSWRATANGLEGAAASATDTCLVLDELGVGEARDVAAAVYTIANGVGKSRAGRDGSLREPKGWRAQLLSSGEIPIEAKIGEDFGRKTRARAGQLVRLVDIPADRGLGFGAFDHAGGFDDAGRLADAIKEAAGSAYGTAGPEFVRLLIASGVEKIVAGAQNFMASFIRGLVKPGSSEQVTRAAKKFAMIAAAGELATACRVTPWAIGDAKRAATLAFESWLAKRGGAASHEERQAVELVRLVIEQHGESRFERVEDYGVAEGSKVRDRLGWRKGEGDQREWWVPPEVWKAEVCAGLDPASVARTLATRGMLRRQDEKNLQCKVRLNDKQTVRCYVLKATILDGGEG